MWWVILYVEVYNFKIGYKDIFLFVFFNEIVFWFLYCLLNENIVVGSKEFSWKLKLLIDYRFKFVEMLLFSCVILYGRKKREFGNEVGVFLIMELGFVFILIWWKGWVCSLFLF